MTSVKPDPNVLAQSRSDNRQLDGHGFTIRDWRNYLSYVGENCRWMFEERPNHQRGTVWHKRDLISCLTIIPTWKFVRWTRWPINFYAPPHSIEAEQAVIGGLLLDDDSGGERVQKVLAMLKPDSFYSRPHKILFEEITRMQGKAGRWPDAFRWTGA